MIDTGRYFMRISSSVVYSLRRLEIQLARLLIVGGPYDEDRCPCPPFFTGVHSQP